MAAAADTRTPALLLAGAGNGFDVENGSQQSGKSELKQGKKYAARLLITVALGALFGMIGFLALGPVIADDGFVAASRGHGMGKAMAKAYVADIRHSVDKMDNAELGSTFDAMTADMCEPSVLPKVKQMLKDKEIKAQLDAMLANPSFPEEVTEIATQALTKGTLSPVKALGKFTSAGAGAQKGGILGAQLFRDEPPAVTLCFLSVYGATLSNDSGP
jgi:hypothetical protein